MSHEFFVIQNDAVCDIVNENSIVGPRPIILQEEYGIKYNGSSIFAKVVFGGSKTDCQNFTAADLNIECAQCKVYKKTIEDLSKVIYFYI